jgi:NAD(P)-dependent dehydrogenase (short-subunit alcohol dehydrogenase family)
MHPLALSERAVVVTGAGRGIGAATARLLARAGARVALLDQDGAGVTQTAQAIGLEGADALAFEVVIIINSKIKIEINLI